MNSTFQQDMIDLITINLVAWDNSRDKKEGLLPEVYVANLYWYEHLTGKEYKYGDGFVGTCAKYWNSAMPFVARCTLCGKLYKLVWNDYVEDVEIDSADYYSCARKIERTCAKCWNEEVE